MYVPYFEFTKFDVVVLYANHSGAAVAAGEEDRFGLHPRSLDSCLELAIL